MEIEFKIIIPPTGDEYVNDDLGSVRAYFVWAYKRLEREGKINSDTDLSADVYVYTPDDCINGIQTDNGDKDENHYARIGAMMWVTPDKAADCDGLKAGAYWCDYSENKTRGSIYARRVSVNGVVRYNKDYDARFE